MEGCIKEVKAGNVDNTQSCIIVRGKKWSVGGRGDMGGMGDMEGRGDQRSRSSWERRSMSKANKILRRLPGLGQPKMARPALKAAVEGERTGASSTSKQPLGHLEYNPFDDEVQHKEKTFLERRLFRINQVAKPSSTAKKVGVEEQPGASSHNWDIFDLGSSSNEEEEVEKKEAAKLEIDENSDNDSDVVFVEHTSNANVVFKRESIVAKLKRNGNVTVGGQLVKMPVPMRKKESEIKQWQDWVTLEQQAWKEASEREQGSPLREADQKWLRSVDKKMRKVLSKKRKPL